MKTRVITAICIFLVVIPIFISKMVYGVNDFIYVLGFILTVVATNEMINAKETEKPLPFIVHLLTYLAVIYLAFANSFVALFAMPTKYVIDIMPYVVIILMMTAVLRKKFKTMDVAFMLFAILYLGLAFRSLVNFFLQPDGMYELIYIILIANITDTFAYFIGSARGKHKLCPDISPKKSVEGAIGGTVAATILVPIYAILLQDKLNFPFNNSVLFIVGFTFVLSIIAQFGDLTASVIKRHFKIKDYGNLFPGHGGVLDRLDSVLFSSLVYFYILDFITRFF